MFFNSRLLHTTKLDHALRYARNRAISALNLQQVSFTLALFIWESRTATSGLKVPHCLVEEKTVSASKCQASHVYMLLTSVWWARVYLVSPSLLNRYKPQMSGTFLPELSRPNRVLCRTLSPAKSASHRLLRPQKGHTRGSCCCAK